MQFCSRISVLDLSPYSNRHGTFCCNFRLQKRSKFGGNLPSAKVLCLAVKVTQLRTVWWSLSSCKGRERRFASSFCGVLWKTKYRSSHFRRRYTSSWHESKKPVNNWSWNSSWLAARGWIWFWCCFSHSWRSHWTVLMTDWLTAVHKILLISLSVGTCFKIVTRLIKFKADWTSQERLYNTGIVQPSTSQHNTTLPVP